MKLHHLLIVASSLLLSQCIIVEDGASNGASNAGSYGQPLTANRGPGTVTIMEGARLVATCTAASPNVEETRFINEQQQIVVKSRGNHGPATVQLFNTTTGRQEAKVMAYDIKNGQPAWAAGMGE